MLVIDSFRFKIQTFSILLLAALFLIGCRDETRSEIVPSKAKKSVYFPNQIGSQPVFLQLAIEPNEKASGLMFRKQLASNHGLCFISDRPKQQSFWMRNTQIPLDLAHFDANGILVEVQQLYPYDETPVKSRHLEIQYSIEMNQGWFKQHKIKPGSRLNLNLLQQAIEARGGL